MLYFDTKYMLFNIYTVRTRKLWNMKTTLKDSFSVFDVVTTQIV